MTEERTIKIDREFPDALLISKRDGYHVGSKTKMRDYLEHYVLVYSYKALKSGTSLIYKLINKG